MSFTESRREFMKSGARAGAALGVIGGLSGAVAAADVAISPVAASAVNTQLLHALGARIGLEVAAELGAVDAPVTLAYIDAAGPAADALRDGIERGIHWETRVAPVCREWQAPYASVLGAAMITNQLTGRSALVEIDPTALSVITLIESVNVPASSQKQAVMTASADNLYRVSYLS